MEICRDKIDDLSPDGDAESGPMAECHRFRDRGALLGLLLSCILSLIYSKG